MYKQIHKTTESNLQSATGEPHTHVQGKTALPLEDNRPQTVIQRSLNNAMNNAVVAQVSVYKKPIQFADWTEWDSAPKNIEPEVASLAQFAIALVEKLKQVKGITARIGGSLAAKMLGGSRRPGDIDLEIPGNAESAEKAKEEFKSLIKRPQLAWINGPHVFFITNYDTAAGVLKITYKSGIVKQPWDMDDDDIDETIKAFKESLANTPGYHTSIDFSSESLFTMKDLVPTDTAQDKRGHYGVEYLIAAYLNRMVANDLADQPDEKKDREQIITMLIHEAKKRAVKPGEIEVFADEVFAKAQNHIKEGNEKKPGIIKLIKEIQQEIPARFV